MKATLIHLPEDVVKDLFMVVDMNKDSFIHQNEVVDTVISVAPFVQQYLDIMQLQALALQIFFSADLNGDRLVTLKELLKFFTPGYI